MSIFERLLGGLIMGILVLTGILMAVLLSPFLVVLLFIDALTWR
jgi:acyl-CoA hydrolase